METKTSKNKITSLLKKLLNKSTISALFILIILYVSLPKISNNYKCPEAYTEDEVGTMEYRKTITSWTSEFFKANPNATMSDWSMAKAQLRVDNNCTEAIQRSKMSGEVSDLKPWEKVDYEIQNALDKVNY